MSPRKSSRKKKTPEEEEILEPDVENPEEAAETPDPDGEAPAPETPADAEELEKTRDRLLRMQADFDNYRKRTQRERGEIAQRANDDLLLELFPVLDHFEMGLATARQHETDDAVQQGFQLVYDQLLGVLRKFGVEPIDAEGEPFDPNIHEAITVLPSEEHPAETVMTQTRRGYRAGDRLLRAAQVVVSSGPAEDATPDAENAESD